MDGRRGDGTNVHSPSGRFSGREPEKEIIWGIWEHFLKVTSFSVGGNCSCSWISIWL